MPAAQAREVHFPTGALKCPVCAHGRFFEREAQLNTATATFFGFDWANKTATCYVCERCGHIDWFLAPPPG